MSYHKNRGKDTNLFLISTGWLIFLCFYFKNSNAKHRYFTNIHDIFNYLCTQINFI